jgi:hypothetical protein
MTNLTELKKQVQIIGKYKTKEQIAADKRHRALLLPTNHATPRNVQKPFVEPRRAQLLPIWS